MSAHVPVTPLLRVGEQSQVTQLRAIMLSRFRALANTTLVHRRIQMIQATVDLARPEPRQQAGKQGYTPDPR